MISSVQRKQWICREILYKQQLLAFGKGKQEQGQGQGLEQFNSWNSLTLLVTCARTLTSCEASKSPKDVEIDT